MKSAEPGKFDIVAGHVEGREVDRGTLTIHQSREWTAVLTLKHQRTVDEKTAEVTLLGDLCAWTGRASIARSSSGQLELTGEGSLAVEPAVGA